MCEQCKKWAPTPLKSRKSSVKITEFSVKCLGLHVWKRLESSSKWDSISIWCSPILNAKTSVLLMMLSVKLLQQKLLKHSKTFLRATWSSALQCSSWDKLESTSCSARDRSRSSATATACTRSLFRAPAASQSREWGTDVKWMRLIMRWCSLCHGEIHNPDPQAFLKPFWMRECALFCFYFTLCGKICSFCWLFLGVIQGEGVEVWCWHSWMMLDEQSIHFKTKTSLNWIFIFLLSGLSVEVFLLP